MECYVYFGMLLTDWEVLLPPVTPLSGIFHSWSRGQHCVWEDSASHVRLQRGEIKIISIFLCINGHRSICHSYFWNVASLKGCMNFEFLYAVIRHLTADVHQFLRHPGLYHHRTQADAEGEDGRPEGPLGCRTPGRNLPGIHAGARHTELTCSD